MGYDRPTGNNDPIKVPLLNDTSKQTHKKVIKQIPVDLVFSLLLAKVWSTPAV